MSAPQADAGGRTDDDREPSGEGRRPAAGAAGPYRLVTDDLELRRLVDTLAGEPRYALDTEFHRERTYWPRLALVQLAWPGELVLVDALAVDLTPLAAVLDGDGLAVMHAAGQDLEVLDRACGTLPRRLFDTQVAAGFVGFSTPSLAVLVERVLGVTLPKGNRLTDWLRRPLRSEQLDYAAADVRHLLAVHDALEPELRACGRLGWVQDECAALLERGVKVPDPETAWLRMKDARNLRGPARGVAQALAAWRERRAAQLDQPVRFVLSDLAIIGIAQHPPSTEHELRRIRGVDERHLRGGAARELLEVIRAGREQGSVSGPARRDELDRELRPAVALLSAWIAQLGRDLAIDTAVLATRADIEGFLRGDGSRLESGWRAELLGEPVRRVVEGQAALAFDPGGRLLLEDRSHRPLLVDLPRPSAPWTRPRG